MPNLEKKEVLKQTKTKFGNQYIRIVKYENAKHPYVVEFNINQAADYNWGEENLGPGSEVSEFKTLEGATKFYDKMRIWKPTKTDLEGFDYSQNLLKEIHYAENIGRIK